MRLRQKDYWIGSVTPLRSEISILAGELFQVCLLRGFCQVWLDFVLPHVEAICLGHPVQRSADIRYDEPDRSRSRLGARLVCLLMHECAVLKRAYGRPACV